MNEPMFPQKVQAALSIRNGKQLSTVRDLPEAQLGLSPCVDFLNKIRRSQLAFVPHKTIQIMTVTTVITLTTLAPLR